MFYKKEGFPEEGDIVVCTVKKILYHSVFVTLDEYKNREGMIHIAEISPGRIRNLRDYVKEGKTLVCKVLRVRQDRNQIDLSLRRVSGSLRAKKLNEMKQEQKAEKILSVVAERLKVSMDDIYKNVGEKLLEEYGSLSEAFQDIVMRGEKVIEELEIPSKYANVLVEIVKERVKPPEVVIKGVVNLTVSAPDGVKLIRKALEEGEKLAEKKDYNLKVTYLSAPRYGIEVRASDYKKAESAVKEICNAIISSIIKSGGEGEFIRDG